MRLPDIGTARGRQRHWRLPNGWLHEDERGASVDVGIFVEREWDDPGPASGEESRDIRAATLRDALREVDRLRASLARRLKALKEET